MKILRIIVHTTGDLQLSDYTLEGGSQRVIEFEPKDFIQAGAYLVEAVSEDNCKSSYGPPIHGHDCYDCASGEDDYLPTHLFLTHPPPQYFGDTQQFNRVYNFCLLLTCILIKVLYPQDSKFATALRMRYDRCAITGALAYEKPDMLQAAHIFPRTYVDLVSFFFSPNGVADMLCLACVVSNFDRGYLQ